ncbi:MAG: hypothetical protein ACYS17_10135 [Planctomycetota bacterium]
MITKNRKLCEEAKPYYYDCLCDQSSELIPESISSHIEQCRHCQEQIKQLEAALTQKECIKSKNRQNTSAVTKMLELHFVYIGERVNCETVRPFLPGLLDPAIEIRIPTPITVHLDNCTQCTEDLKAIRKLNLHSTQLYGLSQHFSKGPSRNTTEFSEMSPAVSALTQRANSGVITIFHIDESAKTQQAEKSDDLYSGFPIRVDVLNPKEDIEQPVSNVDVTTALKEEKVALSKVFKFIFGSLAAAVIIIGFALLLNTTSVEADVRVKISNAIKDLRGVYISTYSADRTKPIQERWISKDSGLYITKRANGTLVVCDILKGEQTIKHLNTAAIETISLPKDIRISIEEKIKGSLGLSPIYDISNLPRDYEWLPVENHPKAAEGFEIYDLKWTVQKKHSYELRKWRFFIDPQTFLPREVEVYGTELEMVMLAESKSDSEIRKVIQDAGF